MSRAIIISNGFETDYSFYKNRIKEDDYVICADGAIRHCINMNIIPNLWVGDFDSCNFDDVLNEYPSLEKAEILRLNPVKDETDTHKCILIAMERGYKEICIWCACGNRADHMLSNIHLLEYVYNNSCEGYIEDSKNIISLVKGEAVIKKQMKYISLLPLDKDVTVKKITGLKYSLENYLLVRCCSLGISNEFVSDSCFIDSGCGLLIVIQSDD